MLPLLHLLVAWLPLAPFGTVGDEQDSLVLADGKTLACRVLLETDSKLVVRANGKSRELERSEVKELRTIERGLAAFLQRFDELSRTDAAAMVELARFAEQQNLPGEAHHTWIRVLTLDPENEAAWTALGGVKRKQGWELKVRGRFYSIEELKKRAADWKNALELPTAHFLIRTDVPAERAVDLAIDLERTYSTFYRVLRSLELYVFDEQPEVHVFADPKDYPAPPTLGMAAWFDRSGNTLYVDATQAKESGTIVAELVDALVFNAFRRTLGRAGEMEPWARKGFAFAFAVAVRPSPGSVTYDFERPYLPYFEQQAGDAKALTLEKVLRAGFASFDSGPDAQRFVAQSYTLVHFLATYENGKYRAGFADFLRSSYLGKGGTSNFFKAIGVDEKALESEWTAHVKRVAGG